MTTHALTIYKGDSISYNLTQYPVTNGLFEIISSLTKKNFNKAVLADRTGCLHAKKVLFLKQPTKAAGKATLHEFWATIFKIATNHQLNHILYPYPDDMCSPFSLETTLKIASEQGDAFFKSVNSSLDPNCHPKPQLDFI